MNTSQTYACAHFLFYRTTSKTNPLGPQTHQGQSSKESFQMKDTYRSMTKHSFSTVCTNNATMIQ